MAAQSHARTVFVFEPRGGFDPGGTQRSRSVRPAALDAYWTALEGTLDPSKVSRATNNALVGTWTTLNRPSNASIPKTASWRGSISSTTTTNVKRNMRAYMTEVVPRVEARLWRAERHEPRRTAVAPATRSPHPNSPLGEQVEGAHRTRRRMEPLSTTGATAFRFTIHGAVAWAHGDEVIHSFGGNVLSLDDEALHDQGLRRGTTRARGSRKPSRSPATTVTRSTAAAQLSPNESVRPDADALGRAFDPVRSTSPATSTGSYTCSGEHAAIRLPCEGWNRAGYTLPSHEVFHAYMQQIRRSRRRLGPFALPKTAAACPRCPTRWPSWRSSTQAWSPTAMRLDWKPCAVILTSSADSTAWTDHHQGRSGRGHREGRR